MIRFRCFRCNHRMRTPDQNAGKVVRCASCKELTFVPSSVDEIEAALAAAGGQDPPGQTVTDADPSGAPPTAGSSGLRAGRSTLKPHNYAWLKFMASTYIAFGAVVSLLGLVWFLIQLGESVSAQARGQVFSRTEILNSCFRVVGGMIVAVTLFSIGQVIFAFRDMVQNSWVTREVVALQRSLAR